MISKNLKYYRILRGLSKKELAEQIGVVPMAITNYENGDRIPSTEILNSLTTALGIRTVDLLKSARKDLRFTHSEFRKNQRLSKSEQELVFLEVEDYFTRFMDVIDILGVNVLPHVPMTHCLELTMDPEKDAELLREELGFPKSGPIESLVSILESKGFLMMIKEIDDSNFSGINGKVGDRPYIMINGKMNAERKRSTIIHELSHIMFNWDMMNLDEKTVEKHATRIAGCFLLPRKDLLMELGIRRTKVTTDMEMIAKEYGISMLMLVKRAEISGIIKENDARDFYKYASINGWRKNEPSRIKDELPEMFSKMVYRAINEDEISIARGSELLGCPKESILSSCKTYTVG